MLRLAYGVRSVRLDPELDEKVPRAAPGQEPSVSEFIRPADEERADQVLRGRPRTSTLSVPRPCAADGVDWPGRCQDWKSSSLSGGEKNARATPGRSACCGQPILASSVPRFPGRVASGHGLRPLEPCHLGAALRQSTWGTDPLGSSASRPSTTSTPPLKRSPRPNVSIGTGRPLDADGSAFEPTCASSSLEPSDISTFGSPAGS